MLKMESRPVGRLFCKLRQWCTLQGRRMRARNNAVASYEDSRWRLHGAEYPSCHRGLRNATLRFWRESNNDDNDDDNVTASAMERGHMVFGTFLRSFTLSDDLLEKDRPIESQINFKAGQAKESKRASLYMNEKNRRDLRYDAFNFFFFQSAPQLAVQGKRRELPLASRMDLRVISKRSPLLKTPVIWDLAPPNQRKQTPFQRDYKVHSGCTLNGQKG